MTALPVGRKTGRKETTMTKMTVNGVSTTTAPGTEQHETFTRRVGRKSKKYVQYDYRHTDGQLFSCIKPTLDACRASRDEWLSRYERSLYQDEQERAFGASDGWAGGVCITAEGQGARWGIYAE